jgi:hypothetical protein
MVGRNLSSVFTNAAVVVLLRATLNVSNPAYCGHEKQGSSTTAKADDLSGKTAARMAVSAWKLT